MKSDKEKSNFQNDAEELVKSRIDFVEGYFNSLAIQNLPKIDHCETFFKGFIGYMDLLKGRGEFLSKVVAYFCRKEVRKHLEKNFKKKKVLLNNFYKALEKLWREVAPSAPPEEWANKKEKTSAPESKKEKPSVPPKKNVAEQGEEESEAFTRLEKLWKEKENAPIEEIEESAKNQVEASVPIEEIEESAKNQVEASAPIEETEKRASIHSKIEAIFASKVDEKQNQEASASKNYLEDPFAPRSNYQEESSASKEEVDYSRPKSKYLEESVATREEVEEIEEVEEVEEVEESVEDEPSRGCFSADTWDNNLLVEKPILINGGDIYCPRCQAVGKIEDNSDTVAGCKKCKYISTMSEFAHHTARKHLYGVIEKRLKAYFKDIKSIWQVDVPSEIIVIVNRKNNYSVATATGVSENFRKGRNILTETFPKREGYKLLSEIDNLTYLQKMAVWLECFRQISSNKRALLALTPDLIDVNEEILRGIEDVKDFSKLHYQLNILSRTTDSRQTQYNIASLKCLGSKLEMAEEGTDYAELRTVFYPFFRYKWETLQQAYAFVCASIEAITDLSAYRRRLTVGMDERKDFAEVAEIKGFNRMVRTRLFSFKGYKFRNEDAVLQKHYVYSGGRLHPYEKVKNNIQEGDVNCSIFVLCDGISRCNYGHLASGKTVEFFLLQAENQIRSFFNGKKMRLNGDCARLIEQSIVGENGLCKYISRIQEILKDRKDYDNSLPPPSTTLVVAYLIGTTLFYLHFGDSRLYVLNDEGIKCTEDHVNERGKLTNVIYKKETALTKGTHFDGVTIEQLKDGDIVFLATDGAYKGYGSAEEIETVLREQTSLHSLMLKPMQCRNLDNLSAIAIEILPLKPKEE